ncbi:hypothetical protein F2Q69_00043783 [Brassica cretica]|uniref:Uncharacterized protein n=1 Tax=Brassica cretica TaxID=69181 RepID=A0A8S9N3M2_BRACR|nr:hypothetical protein F2Q69_00043783 [Brassica cretica]
MEFLETFGCIWSSKEVIKVIIGRAVHESDLPERRYELSVPYLSERPYRSDVPRSHAISSFGSAPERPPGAIPRGCCVSPIWSNL